MLMRRLQGSAAHIESFSVDCQDAAFSELDYARLLARTAGTGHSEVLLDVEAAGAIAGRLVDIYDEPFGDSSAIPTPGSIAMSVSVWRIASRARPEASSMARRSQATTNCLNSDGGDDRLRNLRIC